MNKTSLSHPTAKTLEFNHITNSIYVGTNFCCQLHFDERLLKEGIEADVSLEGERAETPYGVRFYVWLPVVNHQAPTQEQLNFGVDVLESLVMQGKKIYVHCQNGHGRAPTLVAAYLIKQGRTPVEAIDFIKSKRSTIHLEEVQTSALETFFNQQKKQEQCC